MTLRARKPDGTLLEGANIINEVTRSLGPRQSATFSLRDVFGTGASTSSVASVEVQSQNTGLVINGIVSAGNRRFANSQTPEAALTLLPFNRRTAADIPALTLHNTGTSETNVTVTLRTAAGAAVATAQRTVVSLGVIRETFSDLFGSVSLPLDGYIAVRSPISIRSLLINNVGGRPEAVPTLLPVLSATTIFPFFVFGGGYNTTLELINPSDTQPVRVILSAFSPDGTPLTSQPVARTLTTNEKQNFDFANIFAVGVGNSTSAGYFSLTLESGPASNPFVSPPQVFGLVRIGTETASVVLALAPDAGNQFYLTPAAETSTSYTGLAVVNVSGSAASVTVDAFSASGTLLGSTTFNLNSNAARIQLLRELIPQSLNNENMLIRIASIQGNVKLISFRGTLNPEELIYLRGETVP